MASKTTNTHEIGYVTSANDYLIEIEGLPSARISSIISSTDNCLAIVSSLEKDSIHAHVLTKNKPKPGDEFTLQTSTLSLEIGPFLLGKVTTALSLIDHTKQTSALGKTLPIFVKKLKNQTISSLPPVTINQRIAITQQFTSGFTVIDTLIPLAYGQRELIIGEPRSGKTPFLIDLVSNQRTKNMVCVYVLLGKSKTAVKRIEQQLLEKGGLPHTILLAAYSDQVAPLIALTPTLALYISTYFRMQGIPTLLIFDDIALQAKYIREITLLSQTVPGRESYPGDIFFQHSQIMEQGGNFIIDTDKTVSITILPILETDLENNIGFIPTNLMAMTDGHIFFSTNLYAEGKYPGVDIIKSVTRVGKQTQTPSLRELANKIGVMLSNYTDYIRYSRFGTELNYETQRILRLGEIAQLLLYQDRVSYVRPHTQQLLLSLLFTDFLKEKDAIFVKQNKTALLQGLEQHKEFNALSSKLDTLSLNDVISYLNQRITILDQLCQ